jgi:hypothetical protein
MSGDKKLTPDDVLAKIREFQLKIKEDEKSKTKPSYQFKPYELDYVLAHPLLLQLDAWADAPTVCFYFLFLFI